MNVLFRTASGHEFVGRLTTANYRGAPSVDDLPSHLDVEESQTSRGDAIEEMTGCIGRRFFLDQSTKRELLPVYTERGATPPHGD